MRKKLVSFDWAIKLLRYKTNFGILGGFLSELQEKKMYERAVANRRIENSVELTRVPEAEHKKVIIKRGLDNETIASIVDLTTEQIETLRQTKEDL